MTMMNPPHPGSLLRRRIVPALGLNVTEFSKKLGMSRAAVSRVLHEHAAISPDLAVKLEHSENPNVPRRWVFCIQLASLIETQKPGLLPGIKV